MSIFYKQPNSIGDATLIFTFKDVDTQEFFHRVVAIPNNTFKKFSIGSEGVRISCLLTQELFSEMELLMLGGGKTASLQIGNLVYKNLPYNAEIECNQEERVLVANVFISGVPKLISGTNS